MPQTMMQRDVLRRLWSERRGDDSKRHGCDRLRCDKQSIGIETAVGGWDQLRVGIDSLRCAPECGGKATHWKAMTRGGNGKTSNSARGLGIAERS